MLVQAFTVFLALIGTTLSCISTGARVTYAMGRDDEVPGALRHAARQEAHPAIAPSGRWRPSRPSSVFSPWPVYLGGTTPAPLDEKYCRQYLVQLRHLHPETISEAAQYAASS